MDILTQGLLGSAMAQTATQPEEIRRVALLGFIAGLAADADILISSTQDPLLTIEYHRQFTHSLFFIPFGALIVALLMWFFFRKSMHITRIYLFCLLGFSLSGFIDACTSYGTQLLWPVSGQRIAFNIISIIDPIFTLPLMLFLLFALVKKQKRFAFIGLAWCASYLLIGFWQHQRVEHAAQALATSRGHTIESLVVKPSFGNLLVWRSIYAAGEQFYIDAIRAGIDSTEIYQGNAISRLETKRDFPDLVPGSVIAKDIERFRSFSNGYLALQPGEEDVIGDIRYSILPNNTVALWGIKIDVSQPQQHATFMTFRQLTPEMKSQFVDMLTGR